MDAAERRERAMIRRLLCLVALSWIAANSTPARAAAPGTFVPPSPVVRTLPNGLHVAVFEDHRLPIVQVQMLILAGVADEPRSALGVASMTVQMLRQGTSSRTPLVYQRELDRIGGSLGLSAQRDYSSVSASFLARDLEAGIELVADAVLNPVFTPQELETVRNQAMSAVAQSRQFPATLADDHLASLAFAQHPYERPLRGVLESLPGVGVDQVREFYRAYYRPDAAWIAIAGDVTSDQAMRIVESRFGGWAGRRAKSPERPALKPASSPRIRLVDLPSASRAEIRIGWLGPARPDPDVPAVTLVNERLGGEALSSGLATRAGRSAFDVPPRTALSTYRNGGLLSVAMSVPLDSAGTRVRQLQAELERFAKAPVTEAELPRWTNELVNAYPQQFESLNGTTGTWLLAAVNGLPNDAVPQHGRALQGLKLADVNAAASKWLDPSHQIVVVVGPASQLKSQLEALGPVQVVSATGSPVAVELRAAAITTPPTEEQLAQGQATLAKTVTAHGGLTKLRTIKDSTIDADATIATPGQEMSGSVRQVRKEPDRMVYVTDFFSTETYQILAGNQGWAKMGGISIPVQAQELDSTTVAALRFAFLSDLPHLLLAASQPTSKVALRGHETVGDRDADVLEVRLADGRRYVLLVDAENHRLVGMEQNEGPRFARRLYGDYRPVSGILWPYSEDRSQDGQRVMVLAIKKVELNTGVSDDMFRKPSAQ
jgi:zinc protease